MKTVRIIVRILAALAMIAGIVYVVATYGDKIAAWARKLLEKLNCYFNRECVCNCECTCECGAPAEEISVQAEECDFEG